MTRLKRGCAPWAREGAIISWPSPWLAGRLLEFRVRPVNGIFKAVEGFVKIDRGAVLICVAASSHPTTPSSDASQMPPDGAHKITPG